MQVQRQNVLRIHFNHDVAAKTAAAVIEKWISSGLSYSVLIGLVFDELNLDICKLKLFLHEGLR